MSEEIKFEKAIERLEKIVEELEAGDIALDEALKKYEEGVKLSRVCQERLNQAEKKIEILTKTLDGSFKKEPFVYDSEVSELSGEPPRKKSAKTAKTSDQAPEDLLI